MAKKRFQCWLSEEALAELERRAGSANKRQLYLETWLSGALVEIAYEPPSKILVRPAEESRAQAVIAAEFGDSNSLADPIRTAKKVARAERKAELAASVAAALPERSSEDILAAAQAKLETARGTHCPFHRPKWCEPTCKHRVANV